MKKFENYAATPSNPNWNNIGYITPPHGAAKEKPYTAGMKKCNCGPRKHEDNIQNK